MARARIPSYIRSLPIGSPPLRRRPLERLTPGWAIAIVLLILSAQRLLPLYVKVAGLFDLPLLITVFLALTERNVPRGTLIGAAVGLAQDALTHGPIGVFGIIKTLIGYLASSVSLVIEVDFPGARSVLAALFYLIHQLLYWTMQRVLLGTDASLDPAQTLVMSAAHAGVALAMFQLIDRLKRPR